MPNDRISRIPPGSQDLLAGDVKRRRRIQAAWFRLAEARGYEEVIPPTFEYEEVFALGAGPDLSARLVRFVDQDGRVVALRADFTSSIARLAATKLAEAPLPLRLSYAGKVFRQALEGGGHRREAFQLGAELLGEGSAEGDVEVLRLTIDTLRALDLEEFQINLGEMRFIRPLFSGLSEEETESLRAAIDRKDRGALSQLAAELDLPDHLARTLHDLPELIGRAEVLERASGIASDEEAREAIERLRRIDQLLTPLERSHVVYDLGEIQGLGYYTGIRFEVFVRGAGRAVGSGGRYDRLLGLYGVERPAVGFALETDALAELLAEGGS
jgi:ATP phosphoribosyltransferase regulatory subunit